MHFCSYLRFQKNNLCLICLFACYQLEWRKILRKQLTIGAVFPKTEGNSSKQKEFEILKSLSWKSSIFLNW